MIGLLLSLCCGCGTGAYERVLQDRDGRLWDKKYTEFQPQRDVPGSPFVIRMPKQFGTPLCENGKAADGKAVERRRSEPGELGLPPANLTYEIPIADQVGGKQSNYSYVLVESIAKTGGLAKVADQLQKTLTTMSKAPDSGFEGPLGITTMPVRKRDGQTINWTAIRYVGKMDFFYVDKSGKEQYQPMPGVLTVYLHEEAGSLVAVVTRLPKSVDRLIGDEIAAKAVLVLASVATKS